jgi:hypothetical protein
MSIEGVNSPELEVPAHFANATTRRVALGPAADGPIGLSRIIIDDAVVF